MTKSHGYNVLKYLYTNTNVIIIIRQINIIITIVNAIIKKVNGIISIVNVITKMVNGMISIINGIVINVIFISSMDDVS